jgi:nicotinamide-nucleotide amidase
MSGLAAAVHELLLARGETVATAESVTAGLVGGALTSMPGSSLTYRGGVIVYATDLKVALAGVSLALLEERGVVSPDVASALATGARERLGATWGVGLTGVAGPDRQDGQPVGTLHVGLAGPVGPPHVTSVVLPGDREAVRSGAVGLALRLLCDRLAEPEYRG